MTGYRKNILLQNKSRTYIVLYYLSPFIMLAVFVLLWQVMSGIQKFLPSPLDTLRRLVVIWSGPVAKQPMIVHVGMSMMRVVGSLLAAIVLGIPFGVFLGWSRTFRAVFKPIFEIIRPVPPIAWVPLITLWLGTGEIPRMLIIFVGVVMPIVINAYTGVIMVPQINFDVAKIFNAKRKEILFDVVLPSSLNAIFAGIRIALGAGWMVLLAAEMLAAKSGIGFLIMHGNNGGDLTLSLVCMFMIALLGAAFAFGFDYLERWLCPWKRN